MTNNNIIQLLQQAIELQETTSGILVIYVKPRNKNNVIVYDTDTASFDIVEDKLIFYFWDDTYKDFHIKLNNIKSVHFEESNDMIISVIHLKNGNTVLVHSFTN